MGTVAIIVLGVVAITVVTVVGDIISKTAQAKIKAKAEAGSPPAREIEALSGRLARIEARLDEREDAVRKLQDEVRFVSRMLEDRSAGRPES